MEHPWVYVCNLLHIIGASRFVCTTSTSIGDVAKDAERQSYRGFCSMAKSEPDKSLIRLHLATRLQLLWAMQGFNSPL
jgi:hypothetical protein